jgi:hypothetical protein
VDGLLTMGLLNSSIFSLINIFDIVRLQIFNLFNIIINYKLVQNVSFFHRAYAIRYKSSR